MRNKNIAVIGKGSVAGLPIKNLLARYSNSVSSVCKLTSLLLLQETVMNADIVISACGVPNLIKSDWIRDGTVVIDVGFNFIDDRIGKSKICGDV